MRTVMAVASFVAVGVSAATTFASEPRVLACTVDRALVRDGEQLRTGIINQRSFVAKWYSAQLEGTKPRRKYETAQLSFDLGFTSTRTLQKTVHYFFGAHFAQEATDAFWFRDSDGRSIEQIVSSIAIEGHYISQRGESFVLYRRHDGDPALEYSANFLEERDGKKILVTLQGSCQGDRG